MTRSGEIPEAAVEAACDLTYRGQQLTPAHARMVLEFALPYLARAVPQPVDREALAQAWDEGHSIGWKHHQDGNYGNDYWDDTTPNPYRLAGEQEQVEP